MTTTTKKLGPPKVHVKIEVFSNDKKNPTQLFIDFSHNFKDNISHLDRYLFKTLKDYESDKVQMQCSTIF